MAKIWGIGNVLPSEKLAYFIFAIFAEMSFSTATGVYTQ
jgi:hypothetical protein